MTELTPSNRPSVCVFAPAPLLTVTLESAGTGEWTEIHVHAGGQGYWIARMLACVGVDAVLLGGELGQIARWVIEQQGILVAAASRSTSARTLARRR